MNSQFFKYRETITHFHKSGNGPKALIAFHGFGQNHSVFDQLTQQFDNQYTVYAFDLFFHGKSEWNKGEVPLEKIFWNELIEGFLAQEKINKFSLIGFSMGAKFAFAILEAFPHRIESLTLLAPDGVKTSFWYSLATYPIILRNLFKSMILKPGRFHAITRLAYTIRLIDKSLLRFVESQMNTEKKRDQVYFSWVVFRHLHFDMNNIADLINSNSIQFTLVVGKFDKIITVKRMNTILQKLTHPNMVVLETGHNQILQKWLNL